MEWKVDEVPTTERTSFVDTESLHFNETEIKKLQNGEEKARQSDNK